MVPDEAALREQLDRASLLRRGQNRERWRELARAFAAPAWDLVVMCLEDEAEIGAGDAQAFVQSPVGPLPFATRLAWRRAFQQLKGQPKDAISTSIKALVARMREVTDARLLAPLLLAGLQEPLLGISELRHAIRRHRWLDGITLGAELGVACLLLPGPEEFHSMAFGALGRVRTLALGARAAMWVATWDDPSSLEHDWFALGALGEPAAVAVGLANEVGFSVERLAPRLASTLALVRSKGPTAEQGELLERAKRDLAEIPNLEHLVRLEEREGVRGSMTLVRSLASHCPAVRGTPCRTDSRRYGPAVCAFTRHIPRSGSSRCGFASAP